MSMGRLIRKITVSECAIRVIQSCEKGRRCRKRLQRARLLPCDIWSHICRFLRSEDPWSRRRFCIRTIVGLRVVRCKYLPKQGAMHQRFSQMTTLVRKYDAMLSANTRHQAFNLALTVLSYPKRQISSQATASANMLVEYMLNRQTNTFQNTIRDFRM